MDKLALLHQSLGLAFTAEFRPRVSVHDLWEAYRTVTHGNKAADQLPDGCDGCRVDASGNLICCVNQGEEE